MWEQTGSYILFGRGLALGRGKSGKSGRHALNRHFRLFRLFRVLTSPYLRPSAFIRVPFLFMPVTHCTNFANYIGTFVEFVPFVTGVCLFLGCRRDAGAPRERRQARFSALLAFFAVGQGIS
jgi:hypothetical protein